MENANSVITCGWAWFDEKYCNQSRNAANVL